MVVEYLLTTKYWTYIYIRCTIAIVVLAETIAWARYLSSAHSTGKYTLFLFFSERHSSFSSGSVRIINFCANPNPALICRDEKEVKQFENDEKRRKGRDEQRWKGSKTIAAFLIVYDLYGRTFATAILHDDTFHVQNCQKNEDMSKTKTKM